MLHSYRGIVPRLGRGCYLAESASVVGDVELGDDVSVWFQAVLRADVHHIRVGSESNIQDAAVLHVTGGQHPCVLGRRVTVGHRAVVHGARVEDGCLVGIGAVVLDGAVVGAGSLVGAGCLVPPGMRVPAGSSSTTLWLPTRRIEATVRW